MTKPLIPTGQPKYIGDFPVEAIMWNEQHGVCVKAHTSDGLVIIRTDTRARYSVASTDMFYAVERLESEGQEIKPHAKAPARFDLILKTLEETLSDGSQAYNLHINDICIPCTSRQAAMSAGLKIAKAIRECSNVTVDDWLA